MKRGGFIFREDASTASQQSPSVVSVKKLGLAIFILLLAMAAGTWYARNHTLRDDSGPWNARAIEARYVGAQLREVDAQHASLVLTYELQNDTDFDFHLANAPGFVLMARLRPDHSLSAQQNVHLAYATFLPARQQARVALEIGRPFYWPDENDPLLQDKLRDFVHQELGEVEGYVLFDQTNRCEIEFPSGWRALHLASQSGSLE